MDGTPQPRMLKMFRNADITNYAVLGELIDNAWDWGASKISITLENNVLTVEDDGVGCLDMPGMLKLGEFHGEDRTGRFGVGMKQAVMALGPMLNVESVSDGRRVSLAVDWDRVIAGNTWDFIHPVFTAADGQASFMRLKISEVSKERLRRLKTDPKLRDRISLMYYPALKAGKSILFDGGQLNPLPFPALASKQIKVGHFKDGRYRLTMGLLQQPQKQWPHGFNLAFRDRILDAGVSDVYGDYDPHGFFAYLEVIEDSESKWEFNTNKNGIIDQTELLESLLPDIEPLLKRAAQQHRDVHDNELISRIEADLNAALNGKPRKEKRKRAKGKGTHRQTGAGPKRKPVVTQPNEDGHSFEDCSPGTNGRCTGYRISFTHEGPEMASVQLGAKLTFVRFYPVHPAVSQWRKTQDHRELYLQAHNLILTRQRMHAPGAQTRFAFAEDSDPFQDYIEKLSVAAAKTYGRAL